MEPTTGGAFMRIKYYGHAAFRITTGTGLRIIIDPYQSGAFGGALAYGPVAEEADVVLTSHDHEDHNYLKDIKGSFTAIGAPGSYDIKGVPIRAVATYHDGSAGKERGNNLIFVIEADGLALAHCGDLGHLLDGPTKAALGKIDVLLIPIGGVYTLDAAEAAMVVSDLRPAVTVPMHYKTEKCGFPIGGVDEFIAGKRGVKVLDAAEVELSGPSLPGEAEIIVLTPAL
jgi:L-ascorbate metabolism protein UlaG (beta-lactamase superfamily)